MMIEKDGKDYIPGAKLIPKEVIKEKKDRGFEPSVNFMCKLRDTEPMWRDMEKGLKTYLDNQGPSKATHLAKTQGLVQGKKFEAYYITQLKKAGMLPLYIPPPHYFAMTGEILFTIVNTMTKMKDEEVERNVTMLSFLTKTMMRTITLEKSNEIGREILSMRPLNVKMCIDYLFILKNPQVVRESPNKHLYFPAENFPKAYQYIEEIVTYKYTHQLNAQELMEEKAKQQATQMVKK